MKKTDRLINDENNLLHTKVAGNIHRAVAQISAVICPHFVAFVLILISSVPNHEGLLRDSKGVIKHYHDNSHAQEDREQERKVARQRLYVASVICLVFMIGEVLGESLCF